VKSENNQYRFITKVLLISFIFQNKHEKVLNSKNIRRFWKHTSKELRNLQENGLFDLHMLILIGLLSVFFLWEANPFHGKAQIVKPEETDFEQSLL